MPLIETLFTVFEDAEKLLSVDQINSQALVDHKKKLEQWIQLNNAKLANAEKLLTTKEEALTQEEIAERNAIGKYAAIHRDLNALFPIFAYMEQNQETTQSFYAWLLDWQLSLWGKHLTQQRQHILSVELDRVMRQFLEFNKSAAIQYYCDFERRLNEASTPVTRRMQGVLSEEKELNKKLTEKFEAIFNEYTKEQPELALKKEPQLTEGKTLSDWQNYFNDALKGQVRSPSAIIPLALHYYDEPLAFAAILYWLLEHRVTPNTIILSGLLHRFFAGNATDVESMPENSPLAIVYNNLNESKNENAVELCQLAKQYSAYVSDDFNGEMLKYFAGYDLTGRQHTKETMKIAAPENASAGLIVLPRKDMILIKASIYPTLVNIRALSMVFANTFLRLLAEDATIARQFTEEQWKIYLSEVMQSIGDEVTSFPQWFALHKLLKMHQPELCDQVAFKIIELALLHQQQIEEDDELILEIRRSTNRSMGILKARALAEPFNATLMSHGSELTVDAYRAIEDKWRHTNRIMKFILFLFSVNRFMFFPKHIYALQVEIIQQYLKNHAITDIQDALSIMLASHSTEEKRLAHEKQLLLAWLIREVDQDRQDYIINSLFQKFAIEISWDTPYQYDDLFVFACQFGNQSLVSRLLQNTTKLLSRDVIHRGLDSAVLWGNLAVVKDLIDLNNEIAPNRDSIKRVITNLFVWGSVGDRQLDNDRVDVIIYLCGILGSQAQNQITLEKVLIEAAQFGQLRVVTYLCNLKGDNAPSISAIGVCMTSAAAYGYLEIVNYLCGLQEQYAPEKSFINKALLAAVSHGQLSIIIYLLGLHGMIAVDEETVFRARNGAAGLSSVSVFRYLLNLKGDRAPNQEEVSRVLKHALDNHQWENVIQLCCLRGENAPNNTDIHDVIRRAEKEGRRDIIPTLCGLTGEYPLNQRLTGIALEHAAAWGDLDFVMMVCELAGDEAIDQAYLDVALHEAYIEKDIPILAFLCDLKSANAPSRKEISQLLPRAILRCNREIVDIFCHMSGTNAPNSDSITLALDALKSIKADYHSHAINEVCDCYNDIFNTAAPLCHLQGDRAPKEEKVIEVLHLFCDHLKIDFIITVCGLERGGSPHDERLRKTLRYAENQGLQSMPNLLLVKLLTQFDEAMKPALLCFLNGLLAGKTPSDKYRLIANIFRSHRGVMSIEIAAELFDMIDKNNEILGIDTLPRSESWSPAFLNRQKTYVYAQEWAAAWGEVRQLVFDKWRVEINDEATSSERKQALIGLFEGCGAAGSKHHKLMGMGRTTGKPNSKTSRLIETEITNARRSLSPRMD